MSTSIEIFSTNSDGCDEARSKLKSLDLVPLARGALVTVGSVGRRRTSAVLARGPEIPYGSSGQACYVTFSESSAEEPSTYLLQIGSPEWDDVWGRLKVDATVPLGHGASVSVGSFEGYHAVLVEEATTDADLGRDAFFVLFDEGELSKLDPHSADWDD